MKLRTARIPRQSIPGRADDGTHPRRGCDAMTDGELDRVPAILADIARFAGTARRVTDRGHDRFTELSDDDQRRIARPLVIDLSAAADRLPQTFRDAP